MLLPETVALGGSALWILAALITGLPRGRVPSEFPFIFSMFGAIGAAAGLTKWTGGAVDVWLFAGAAALYVLLPIVLTGWLLHRYDPEDADRDNPRTVT